MVNEVTKVYMLVKGNQIDCLFSLGAHSSKVMDFRRPEWPANKTRSEILGQPVILAQFTLFYCEEAYRKWMRAIVDAVNADGRGRGVREREQSYEPPAAAERANAISSPRGHRD